MKVYLSGPMTGLPDLNFPAFREAAATLRALGAEVYNPAEYDDRLDGAPFVLSEAFVEYATYICREADAVVALPGSQNSPGATAEMALARALGKPVLRYDAEQTPVLRGGRDG